MDFGSLFQQVLNLIAGLFLVFVPALSSTSAPTTILAQAVNTGTTTASAQALDVSSQSSNARNDLGSDSESFSIASGSSVSGIAPFIPSFVIQPASNEFGPANFTVDFGDGNTSPLLGIFEYGTGLDGSDLSGLYFNHTYLYPGAYTVKIYRLGSEVGSIAIKVIGSATSSTPNATIDGSSLTGNLDTIVVRGTASNIDKVGIAFGSGISPSIYALVINGHWSTALPNSRADLFPPGKYPIEALDMNGDVLASSTLDLTSYSQ